MKYFIGDTFKHKDNGSYLEIIDYAIKPSVDAFGRPRKDSNTGLYKVKLFGNNIPTTTKLIGDAGIDYSYEPFEKQHIQADEDELED